MVTIIHNAKIYLERDRFCEALRIEDGIVRAVGTNAEILADIPEDALRYDARGRTVVPGFIDSHQHLLSTGIALADVRLGDAKSIADVKAITRRYIEERRPAPGTVLHGTGWNQDYFEDERRLLTAADLDDISTEYPIVFERACLHLLTANTRAMELAGVTADTPDPEGGAIGRLPDGRPDGIFSERARALVKKLLANPSVDEKVRLIRTAMRHAAETGVTSVHTCDLRSDTWRETLAAYERIDAEGPVTRVCHQAHFMNAESYREFLAAGHVTGSGTPTHRFGPLKLFVDGSLGARTALMRRPYADDPTTSGIATLTCAEIDELVGIADQNGCSVAVHAIGDLAVERMLDAYEKVTAPGFNPLRHGIIHVQITDRPLVERFRTNDILAYVQPIFLHYDTRIVEERVGKELASTSYAFGTMKELGVHMSFGTDSPIEDMNPIDNLYCAVTRRTLDGAPEDGWHPEECLDVPAAVDAYTVEGAYASFEEDVKGRLQPGYYADLVVLSEDIFTMPPEELRRTKVDATMMGGRFVFEREGA